VATLTKAQIVEKLFARNIFTKGECAHVIETLFELMKQSLESGEDILISGFGKFSVKQKHQRRGRNPQTGEPIQLVQHCRNNRKKPSAYKHLALIGPFERLGHGFVEVIDKA